MAKRRDVTISNSTTTSITTGAGRITQADLESSTRAPRAEEAGTGKIMPWPEDPPKPVTLDDLMDRARTATNVVCQMRMETA